VIFVIVGFLGFICHNENAQEIITMQTIKANTFKFGHRKEAVQLLRALRETDGAEKPMLVWGGEKRELPEEIIPMIACALQAMARGQAVSLITRPEWFTTRQAAEMIACSRQHVVDLINEKKLKDSKIGTHRRIKLDDLLEFIEQEDRERDAAMAALIEHTEATGGYELK
jgi:excisionase family DNA binding protein